ncbi:MAG TPA: hypothetical protein VLB44_14140 [Kofleriaceae bacterium]|nr:hypothetical protein [Kofleriaceae bacterium]
MTFRKLLAFAGIGGLLYAHKRHGGTFTMDSFKQSWNDLLEGARTRAKDLRSEAETRLHEAATKVSDATETAARSTSEDLGGAKDVTGYGSSGYGYGGGSQKH